jgi:hypothetical protein
LWGKTTIGNQSVLNGKCILVVCKWNDGREWIYWYFDCRLTKLDENDLPPASHTFEYKLEKDVRQVFRSVQRALSAYKDEKRGPTYIAIQSPQGMKPKKNRCLFLVTRQTLNIFSFLRRVRQTRFLILTISVWLCE